MLPGRRDGDQGVIDEGEERCWGESGGGKTLLLGLFVVWF